MGATLPLLVAVTSARAENAGRVAGTLYAANALGAVAGCLGCALLLLPRLGVALSTLVAAAMNVGAAGLVWRSEPPPDAAAEPEAPKRRRGKAPRPEPAPETPRPARLVLFVLALSGLAALADEVAWTRALVLLIGPTAYAFAFILATVVAGIALGSAAAAAILARVPRPGRLLALSQVAVGAASLGVVLAIGHLPVRVGETVQANADRMGRLLALEAGGVAALLGLPCVLFGAAFPFAVQLLAREMRGAAPAAARVYAWNTVGAVLGAVLAGFVVLPRFGIQTTLVAAAMVHAVAGALVLRRRVVALAVVAAFAVAAALLPRWDPALLSGGVYKYAVYAAPGRLEDELRAGELIYYREGAETTVSVKRVGGTLSLAVDGKVDATSGGDMLTQRLLAHLPLLLHPAPREACVIGLGSGVTAGSALAHPLARLEAVEISPEVVEAARLFEAFNRAALGDPRLALRVADGRNHLLLGRRRYDVIISEPSNPWMAGVSSLFTRDFFALVRSRLAPGGLFCQWAHIYNMAPADLRTVVAGFTDVFRTPPCSSSTKATSSSSGPLRPAGGGRRRARAPHGGAGGAGRPRGGRVRSPAGLPRSTPSGTALARFAAGAPRHTDDRPRLEFSAPRSCTRTPRARTGPESSTRPAERRGARGAGLAALGLSPPRRARAGGHAGARRQPRVGDGPYREALDADPRAGGHEGLVRTALRSGRAGEAEPFLRRLADGPASASARVALGLLYHNTNRPAEALTELAAASEADPRSVRPLMLGAEVQEAGGNLDAAEGLARRALEVAPGDADAEGFLAAASLAAAVRTRPRPAPARSSRALPGAARPRGGGDARAQKGDRAAARLAFESLVAAEPDGVAHLDNFALFEMEGGDPRAAARLFHQAVSLDPEDVRGYRGLREAARALRDSTLLARAESALRRLGAP
jgi:spermidine synthase